MPLSQSSWKEKGAAVCVYSKIAMAKLGAAVGNARVPAHGGTRAHTGCFIQVGDAGQVTGPFLHVVGDHCVGSCS